MLARVRSARVFGIEADDVFVEVDVAPGLPSFTTVGLPDATFVRAATACAPRSGMPGSSFPWTGSWLTWRPQRCERSARPSIFPWRWDARGHRYRQAWARRGPGSRGGALARQTDPARARCAAGGAALPAPGREAPPRARGQCRKGRRGLRCDGDSSGNARRCPRRPQRRARHPCAPAWGGLLGR